MSDEQKKYEDDVTSYRQPMVTSIGIIIGFLLAFLANWAITEDDSSALVDTTDWFVAMTLMVGILLMVTVLFRLLDNRIRQTPAGVRYQVTFRIYMISIILSFIGLVASLIV